MANTTSKAEKIIARILKEIGDEECIFRGTSKEFSTKKYDGKLHGVNSSLYRWGLDNELGKYIDQDYPPSKMEERVVADARQHFPSRSTNLEIVTALRHFEGKVNVIDFSTDLYVALFFACAGDEIDDNGDPTNGELIFINKANLKTADDIKYKDLSPKDDPVILTPSYNETSRSRVAAQKSVFVYSPKGYLAKKEYKRWRIRGKSKKAILAHLEKFHGISQNSIYNDLFGFIQNEKDYDAAAFRLHRADAKRAGIPDAEGTETQVKPKR